MRSRLFACLISMTLAAPLAAAPVDDVMQAVRIDDMVDIMRDEGLLYGEELAFDMFGGPGNAQWNAMLSQIYDTEKMGQIVRDTFRASFGDAEAAPLLEFFESGQGERIVRLELDARKAMIDDDVEEAARASFQDLDGSDDRRLAQVETFVESNDLIEANVAGAMNASFQFYRGLVDGGAFAMTEQDILSDVWSQESDTRQDTREWLFAFLLLAYGPLEDGTLDDYIAMSVSPEGRALNQALFDGFNKMYDEISYALGLAVAQQMQGEDL
ncbi:DUF2059 domain-containing protein [Tropicibacter oceani]|uniref:DUF2059 domain-containing protein n=1 Tax=Tropicibacter oceani TaxID=3058420 RepID=A0ABY8QFJ8_9RHOB|nr:DUF2059 domain-containing protein [Tropicibacter oceani]WGW02972.1 DUF2059 domain-containing protein [Tropicibacter oceani]